MSTSSTARRSTSPPASAPTSSSYGRRSTAPQGRAAIKSFVVERENPGLKLERLEHKLGIRASDTAAFRLEDCRVPLQDMLGSAEINVKQGFAGAMQTFDNTRPLVAAMAVGLARACLEETRELLARGRRARSTTTAPANCQHAAAARLLAMEADYEAARLLTLQAAWMADNSKPELAAGLDGEGEGRPCLRRGRARLRRAVRQPSATARASCWRSGPATPRSSTSSRGPSRSSC